MIPITKNEATAAYRRMYFHCVDATDGMTPEAGEAGGQPQISYPGAEAYSNTGIGVLVFMGGGDYYAELSQAVCNSANKTVINGRYKSANTAEALGTIMQIIEFPVDASVAAIGVSVASLPKLIQISAAVVALGGIGGIITGVVDAGVTVSSSFRPISMEKGEKKVLVYQIKENDVAIDVSAYTFQFGVKRDLYDTTYAFAVVAGVITADSDGVLSIVTFIIPAASTKALATFESGRYSVGMYDGSGNKAALTPPGGVEFRLTEDILDVA